jgi:hypothetical protein
MAPSRGNRIYLISLILAVSVFSALLALLPYKHYTSVPIFLGGTQPGTQSIFGLLRDVLTGSFDPWVIPMTFPFVTIFSPVVILAEFAFSRQRARGRTFFFVRGALLLCSALWMLWIMNLDVLEVDVKLLPTFYGVLCWVVVPAVFSFILMATRIQTGFRCLIASQCGSA